LAFTHHNLAGSCLKFNKLAEAEEHYRQSADIRLELMQKSSDPSPHHRLGAAGSLATLVLVYRVTGRPERAREAYQKVEDLIGPVLEVPSLKTEAALTLAGARQNIAELLQQQGKSAEAVAVCNRGLELAEPVLAREPEQDVPRQCVANLRGTRGQANMSLERYREAAVDYDRLVQLSKGEERDHYRVTLAALLAAAGDFRRATAEADDLTARAKLTDLNRFNLACTYGMAAKAPGATADRVADQAMGLLKGLQEAGFFKNPTYGSLLREAPEFDALRARPDFKQLLQRP
jgi:tetratricopeptide (TPR) repeat protein